MTSRPNVHAMEILTQPAAIQFDIPPVPLENDIAPALIDGDEEEAIYPGIIVIRHKDVAR